MASDLATALADLDEPRTYETVEGMLAAGASPAEILAACQEGIRLVGERYAAGEYYVSDLMMSSAIFKKVAAGLGPLAVEDATEAGGRVVMGTVSGDIHDIGKDLVVSTLRAAGYAVTDLGVNVAPEAFVQALKDTGASVLGLSGLLTTSFDPMRDTVLAAEAAELRPGVRIMLGGGPVDETVREQARADAVGADPPAAVRLADAWMEELR